MLVHSRSDSKATMIPFSADRLSPKALSLVPRKHDIICLGQSRIHVLASLSPTNSHGMSSNVKVIAEPASMCKKSGPRC